MKLLKKGQSWSSIVDATGCSRRKQLVDDCSKLSYKAILSDTSGSPTWCHQHNIWRWNDRHFDDVAGHDAYQAHPLHNEVHKGEPNAHERHGKLRSCGRIELATDSSTVDTDQSKGFIPALMSRTLTMVPGGWLDVWGMATH